jgi:hypothetical protein
VRVVRRKPQVIETLADVFGVEKGIDRAVDKMMQSARDKSKGQRMKFWRAVCTKVMGNLSPTEKTRLDKEHAAACLTFDERYEVVGEADGSDDEEPTCPPEQREK